MRTSTRRNLLLLAASTIFSLALLEAAVYAIVGIRHLPIARPSYSFARVGYGFWMDLDPHFGVWHPASAQFRHRTACYDVTYKSNSYGARDDEHARQSSATRVVVLGDSFVEGWGVEKNDRLVDVLQRSTGLEYLDFGTAGGFGTTQEWQQYEHLVSTFSHDAVLLGVLPDNDFEDNSLEAGRLFHGDQYRPYLEGKYPDYKLVYFRSDALNRPLKLRIKRYVKGFLREFTETYNLLSYMRAVSIEQEAERKAASGRSAAAPARKRIPSQYYDYTSDDWDRMRYSIERLVAKAGKRPVLVFTIPRINDLRRYDADGQAPLTKQMTSLADSLGFAYVDLLAPMHDRSRDWDSYFIRCDGHWSPAGNRVAASLLLEAPLFTQLGASRTIARAK